MKNYVKTIAVVLTLLMAGSFLSGCQNTVRGVGQDMDRLTTPR